MGVVFSMGFCALSIFVGMLGAHITWELWLKPWLGRGKYIVYVVDTSLRQPGESIDDFMARVREEDLGKYEIVNG